MVSLVRAGYFHGHGKVVGGETGSRSSIKLDPLSV